MAYRTTVSAVEGIIEVDSTTISDITPFIAVANELVTECCASAGYSESRLELLERWLTAHFYAIRDPRVDTEKAGSVSVKYQYKVDLGFNVTTYGQQALLLDTAGGLIELQNALMTGKKKVIPGVTWLGTENWGEDTSA